MPAKSKEQQRLFGMVHAYQKGELKDASEEVKDIAKTISKKDAKDFAETKHKGLPNKVKKNVKETVKINESQLRKIIAESINRVLKESYYDNEPMRARIPSRVMPSTDRLPGHDELENPYIPTAKQIRGATDAAYKMNKIVKKFVYEAEEANESWTIDSLAQEIFSKFSKINGFQYGAPHVYEFTIEDIRKRITAYVKKVYNNLFYFEENGNI